MELSKVKFNSRVPIIIKGKIKVDKDNFKFLYLNTKTNKRSYVLEDVIDTNKEYCIVDERKSSFDVGIIDIKYDKSKDMLVIMLLKYNAGKINSNINRKLEEVDRIYIKRNKNVLYKSTKWGWSTVDRCYKRIQKEHYQEVPGYEMTGDVPFIMNKYYVLSKSCFDEVNKMFPKTVTLSGNKIIELNNLDNLNSFIKYKEPIIKNGSKQKEVDELVKIPLEEIKNIPDRDKFAVISKVNHDKENMCVLRTFLKTENGIIYEGGRIYIGKKTIVSCKKNNDGTYIKTTLLSKPEHWNFAVEDFNPENSKGTKLEYFGEILSEINIEHRGLAIWAFIKWDITEKMFKSEFKEFMKEILNRSIDINPINYLENQFGKFSGDKNIYKNLGINKYQASVVINNIDENLDYSYNKLSYILFTKIILSGTQYYSPYSFLHHYSDEHINIANIDNETFDKVYNLVKQFDHKDYRTTYFIRVFSKISSLYGTKTLFTMENTLLEIWEKIAKENPRDSFVRSTTSFMARYADYLEMVSKVNDTVNFKASFKSIEDIPKMHDAVCIVYNLQRDKVNEQKFIRNIEKWEKWNFEDDEFAIIAPKKPADLAKEGLELHHCVKSYIENVSNGFTNILFLRRKNEIDKPFYTIEISNSGSIEQIHGFANCNIDTNPEIIPFLENWIKNKKLKRNNINKVR
jgi:hypothetical protein